jgi:hypothetical protein
MAPYTGIKGIVFVSPVSSGSCQLEMHQLTCPTPWVFQHAKVPQATVMFSTKEALIPQVCQEWLPHTMQNKNTKETESRQGSFRMQSLHGELDFVK